MNSLPSMDHVDLTQAAVEALQSAPSSATASHNLEEAHDLRGRILGVLIRRGRLAAQLSAADCASILHVDAQQIETWEVGASAPSLPQLELLTAYMLAVTGGDSVESTDFSGLDSAEYCLLRQRMIGAKLKLARQAQDLGGGRPRQDFGPRYGSDCAL